MTLLLLLAATGARAEEAVTAAAAPTIKDLFQARIRYGVAVRSGSQQDAGPSSLTYNGLTPNDLALSGWGWFALGGHLGAFLNLQREAFALFAANSRVTGGGLIRASLGPTGRLTLGPVRLEAAVGYAFHQLPTFGDSGNPIFATGTRHGVLLAARGVVDIGPVAVEARGEVPLSVAAKDGAGQRASSSGFVVGGSVRVQLFRTGALMWGVLGDFSYSSDSLTTSTGLNASQTLIRAGGALDLMWKEEAAVVVAPALGELQIQVVDAATNAPLPGAAIDVAGQQLVADKAGLAHLGGLPAGAVTARASAGGYLPVEDQANVEAGGNATLLLKLGKQPPKVGTLVIRVSTQGKAPLASATVKVGDQTAPTDTQGVARFADLKPGPVAIAITADGYNRSDEAATVAAGQESEVAVAMVELKKRVPATINGLVRSTRGGKPVAADLEIPQLKIKTRANPSGAFSFRLEGGTYTVNISAPGYLPQSKSVTVKDGDQAIFNVDLHPK